MKIAYVFAYFGDGGAEEHAILLAQKARDAGHNPLFIISRISDSARKKLLNGKFQIIYLPMESSFRPFLAINSAIGIKKLVKSENINVIHTHMLREQSLTILAKFLGCRIVLIRTFHRLDQFNWKMKPLMRVYFKFTNATISTSVTMSCYLDANGWKNQYSLIENGAAKVDAPKHDQALGFIGRLAKEKGILEFIKANIDVLRKTKMVIAGDGPDYESIRRIVKDNKLNIEMLGNVLNKSDFYKKISVLVLPSETEVLPLVVLEAYSCGLPIIAFDIESLRGLIKKDNGVLVKFPDYTKMGVEALNLLSNLTRYCDVNIKRFEQKYSADIMWSKTYRLYESLVNAQRSMLK